MTNFSGSNYVSTRSKRTTHGTEFSSPFFILFLKSGIDKSMEWSMIPMCPSLMCFFNRGDTEGTNSLKILCLMFVYVFCTFVSGLILLFLDDLWFGDLHAG